MHPSSSKNLQDYIEKLNNIYSSIRESGYDVFVYRPSVVKSFNKVKMFRLPTRERGQEDDGSIGMNDSDLNLIGLCLGEHVVKFLKERKAKIFLFNPQMSDESFSLKSLEEVASGSYAFISTIEN